MMVPPTRIVIAVTVLAVAILGAVLIVFGLSPVEDRGILIGKIGNAIPILIGSIPAVMAYYRNKDTAAKVDSVNEKVNGRMTDLIAAKTIPNDTVIVPSTYLNPLIYPTTGA